MKHWTETIDRAHKALMAYVPNSLVCDELHAVLDEMLRQQEHLMPNWSTLHQPIMTVDFDGVISEYKHGWRGPAEIMDEKPVPGAIKFLEEAVKHFTVLIFSSRTNYKSGTQAIHTWLKMCGLSDKALSSLIFQPGKPSAHVMIDDRAIAFMGAWSDIGSPEYLLDNFRPWYYTQGGWRHAQEQTRKP